MKLLKEFVPWMPLIPIAETAHDTPTADLATSRIQIHEKTAWMLRSLING